MEIFFSRHKDGCRVCRTWQQQYGCSTSPAIATAQRLLLVYFLTAAPPPRLWGNYKLYHCALGPLCDWLHKTNYANEPYVDS